MAKFTKLEMELLFTQPPVLQVQRPRLPAAGFRPVEGCQKPAVLFVCVWGRVWCIVV